MRSPKGKILSWIVFIVLILLIFGLIYYFQVIRKAPTEGPPPVITPPTTTEKEEEEKPTKPKGFAVPQISESKMEELDNEAYNKALQSGKGCEEIKYNKDLKQQCLDSLLYNSALTKQDEKLCQQIVNSDLKVKCLDQVYFNIATKTKNKDLCEKITDKQLKQKCSDQILAFSGREVESAETCESIQDGALKQNCLDNFYFASSVKNLTEESCENIKDAELKERCNKTIIKNLEVMEISKAQVVREYKSYTEQLEDCGQLSDDKSQTCKDEANYNLAAEKKDLSYCNAIQNAEKQTQCIKVQSSAINNYYLRQATYLKDPSLCAKILDEALRTTCSTYAQ